MLLQSFLEKHPLRVLEWEGDVGQFTGDQWEEESPPISDDLFVKCDLVTYSFIYSFEVVLYSP